MKTLNQYIKPKTLRRNDKGNLEIGGCDLVTLAKEHKTPLYVIDEDGLRSILRQYKRAFETFSGIKFLYASKACINLGLASVIASEGFGFDVVSGGEIYTVYKAGVDMSTVLFNGNNKSEEELMLALDFGVGRFSVDNFLELELLNKLACDKKVDILLRITPGIECHTHDYIKTGQLDSKFGFDMSQIDESVSLIQNKYKNLNLVGLHTHVGSQIFELKVFEDEIDILAKEVKRLKLEYNVDISELNIGGGIGVKYIEEDTPVSIDEIAHTILSQIKNHGLENLTFYMEPGRSIISPCGVTLYTVGSSKTVSFNSHKYVSVDGGMADNPRPSLYGAKYSAEVATNKSSARVERVTIAGKYCESGDILIDDIELPELFAGDILCVYNTGAYNYSMASNYNRHRKAKMILVNNSQSDIIVERESYDDIIALDRIPERGAVC